MTLLSALAHPAHSSAPEWRRLLPALADWAILVPYALCFALLHGAAASWGGEGYYSLWFPAAGFRFALLWRRGARLAPVVALLELGVDLIMGVVVLDAVDGSNAAFGALRPALVYGLVIAAVRRLAQGAHGELLTRPMPLAFGIVLAPLGAVLAALPQGLLRPELTGVANPEALVLSLTAFFLGDLLGILLITPPLLWVTDAALAKRLSLPRISPAAVAEVAAVLSAGWAIGATLAWIGLGLQPAPALIAVTWVGLRFGRAGAWISLLLACMIVLPYTAGAMSTMLRLQVHLGLATVVMTGYLAGSFADARLRARADIARRDRLLFQAERLKTLRAMSVAVIHEISQPLSTLAIEARHLSHLTNGGELELAATAALIDTKVRHLSELVRRLRRFGGRAADEPSPVPIAALIDSVLTLLAPELRAASAKVSHAPVDPDLVVMGQEVELGQALANLVRNAAQALQGGSINLSVTTSDGTVEVAVTNLNNPAASSYPGMGVGLLVTRAIVAAHGGSLDIQRDAAPLVRAAIRLPLVEKAD